MWLAAGVIVSVLALGAVAVRQLARGPERRAGQPNGPAPGAQQPSFCKDIAPIIYQNCSRCHRPGESAPFSLLSYADVKRHARDIVDVTRRRYMPPWLPEPTAYPFADEARLTDEQIQRLATWCSNGCPEGRPADLPPMPQWTEGWELGPPDLVLKMSEPYALPASGKDVYRNFVLPVPLTERRYIRAFQFRPGSKAVHHAFVRIDGSGKARELDQRDAAPGFEGMVIPPSAESPTGHFLGWQPGRGASVSPEGMPWILQPGADLVLLMHMQPLGRLEPVQPSLALYFTETPPANTPVKIGLRSYSIDIPAGATNYVVQESVRLPAQAALLALVPHAHYLGKRLEGLAILPSGATQALLRIPQWDFNWQREYRFAHPIALPAGTTLAMRFSYDNSTNNIRNPNDPPARIQWGLQTTNEMGELWFQLVAQNAADFDLLTRTAQAQTLRDAEQLSRKQLRADPEDAEAATELGKVFLATGKVDEAEKLFRKAIELRPALGDAWYHLGLVLMGKGELAGARQQFSEVVRLNPQHYQALNNLGICCLRQQQVREAAAYFRQVLTLNPKDELARENLALAEQAMRAR